MIRIPNLPRFFHHGVQASIARVLASAPALDAASRSKQPISLMPDG